MFICSHLWWTTFVFFWGYIKIDFELSDILYPVYRIYQNLLSQIKDIFLFYQIQSFRGSHLNFEPMPFNHRVKRWNGEKAFHLWQWADTVRRICKHFFDNLSFGSARHLEKFFSSDHRLLPIKIRIQQPHISTLRIILYI